MALKTATQHENWKIIRSMSAFERQEKIRVAAGFLLSCFYIKYVAKTEREGVYNREGRHRRKGAVRSRVRSGKIHGSDRAVYEPVQEQQDGLQGIPRQGMDEEVLYGGNEGRYLRAVYSRGRRVQSGRQERENGLRGGEGGQGCDRAVYEWRKLIIIRNMDSIFRSPEKRKWAWIPGHEGMYKVSNLGEVYSANNECLLEVIRGKWVNLSNLGKVERYKVAYLVARMFVPNPELRPYVVHVNGDRTDHRASNLIWSEKSEEDIRGRRVQKGSRKVLCYSEEGELVGKYESVGEAAKKIGVAKQGIMRVCSGKGKRCGGYIWRYE